MSITTSNGHVPKRRKLSHSSNDGEKLQRKVSTNGTKAQGDADQDEPSRQSVAKVRPSTQANKNSSTLMTGGMTKSSLTQLQVNELLDEVRPDYDHNLRKLRSTTDALVQAIKAIPERSPLSLPEAEKTLRKKSGIAIPFGAYRPNPDIKYKFEYQKPDSVRLRGGIVQHTSTKENPELEIAVQMPSALFQEKDYLNHRALHKRAYYTACTVAGLKDEFKDSIEFQYEFRHGNDLVPVLAISLAKTSKSVRNVRIRINTVLPSNIGPLHKMLPDRNCIRANSNEETGDPSSATATPVYNSTLRALASTTDNDKLIETTIRKCDAFADVCLLGQTWLHQRGFTSDISAGGFGLSEWTFMCALFLKGGGHRDQPLFSDRYSSVQLFKAMLQVLANRDLTDPLLIGTQTLQVEKSNLPVLLDASTGVNVLSQMSKWSYESLRQYAQQSLTAINARAQDNFDASFITKVAEPNLQYDEIYVIETPSSKHPQDLVSIIHEVLKQGLTDRVSFVDIKQQPQTSWDLNLSGPKPSKNLQTIEVRLLLNPDATNRLIDHGPTAEQQEEAREFRKFWGDKSELRRFRDGSITETLVWSSAQPVTTQIIQYLAAYHFKILPSSIQRRTPDLQTEHLSSKAPLNAEEAFKLISSKYQELSSKLHQMEGLPLPIRSVSPAGPALRSASINNPLESSTAAPIDIVIQFDSSARWPDHLLAIQHTKVAFLAKISDLITEADSSLTTRVGLENTNDAHAEYHNTSFLDIICPSPASGLSSIVFRLRIHHEREQQLLQNLLSDKSLPNPTRDIVASALTDYKRTFLGSTIHTTSIRNLITHFQPLSGTIRLFKSWIASHNLSNHMPDAVLEIIAAHVFLHPYPWSTPGNSTVAFLRCLQFLSRWDWASSPLIVDLSVSQDMPSSQVTELETRFQAWKKLDPNMNTVAWFVGTNIDNTGTMWTQGTQPARVIASRTTALANAAITLIKLKGTDMSSDDWKSLFVSPTSDFDFVIHLKPSIVHGKKSRRNEAKFKNLQVQEDLDVERIGHEVVSLYLNDLEKAFANTVMFFHGEREGCIAGLWRPSVTGQRDWRVRIGFSTVPYAGGEVGEDGGDKVMAEVNKDGILAEIALLGEGMVEKVSVRK